MHFNSENLEASVFGYCAQCDDVIYVGDVVYHDSYAGGCFCSRRCAETTNKGKMNFKDRFQKLEAEGE